MNRKLSALVALGWASTNLEGDVFAEFDTGICENGISVSFVAILGVSILVALTGERSLYVGSASF
jgi:hypothetical protein